MANSVLFPLLFTLPWALGTEDEEHAGDHHRPIVTDPRATLVQEGSNPSAFRPRIVYGDTIDVDGQRLVYGDKYAVPTQHPIRIAGRPLYRVGELGEGINLIGEDNLLFPSLLLYGDWRTAAGYSDEGASEVGRFSTRMNLDVDLGLTATERLHAFFRPLDRDAQFTGFDFAGDTAGDEQLLVDGNLETLFFEGDLGAIFGGPGVPSVPVAAGKFPLLFQNGVWVEDAFTGVAVTFPAKNSPKFDISNYDWTFFVGFDDVTTGANAISADDENDVLLVGATTFLEANEGYWELGYGYTDGSGVLSDIDYHNFTAAFSRRYGAWLSNSIRGIVNVGQDLPGAETADGALLLLENSLITRKPSTLIPYLNAFAGLGTPQSLARDGGAGGVLKNTGINFEADALTRFPALNATGHDAFGAAVGVEYLFGLDKQVVLEAAYQTDHGGDAKTLGDEVAIGARVQFPLSHRFILRFDAMQGWRENGDDIAGVRMELRLKF